MFADMPIIGIQARRYKRFSLPLATAIIDYTFLFLPESRGCFSETKLPEAGCSPRLVAQNFKPRTAFIQAPDVFRRATRTHTKP